MPDEKNFSESNVNQSNKDENSQSDLNYPPSQQNQNFQQQTNQQPKQVYPVNQQGSQQNKGTNLSYQQNTYQSYKGGYQQNQGEQNSYQQSPTPNLQPSTYDSNNQYNELRKNHHTLITVCGVLSIIAGLFYPIVAFVLGIIAIIFALRDKATFGPQNYAKAGFICGIIGIVLGILTWISIVLLMLSGLY